jgi:patatin-like phospholipase/acyl hydrolase
MRNKFVRILSIDGGGIRGIIPGWILVNLEEKLKLKTNSNARISDFFDLISGTSTGGILACAYLTPDRNQSEVYSNPLAYKAEYVANLYKIFGPSIFKNKFFRKGIFKEKYDPKGLEQALEANFHNDMLCDLLKPCLITSYDIERRKGHFFYQHKAKINSFYNFMVKDVARSTSAAPTYFSTETARSVENVSFSLIDGGVFVNNPSLCAYSEARELFRRNEDKKNITVKDIVMLSIGTGKSCKPINNHKVQHWGAIQWTKPLIDIMMSGVADTVHYQLDQIFDSVNANHQYLRINKELPENINLATDDASEENMQQLKEFGIELAHEYDEELDRIVELLIQTDSNPPNQMNKSNLSHAMT